MLIEFNQVLVITIGVLIAFGIMLLSSRYLLNITIDHFIKRLLQDPYPENLSEMYNVFSKVGIQNILETDLRASSGKPLERPFGSPNHFSRWEQLLLNPVYLTRAPLNESVGVDTKVVIGPQAQRPLEIGLPIMITGMCYGISLSQKAKLALAKGANAVETATNTGVGPFLPAERQATKRLTIQYHRGWWGKDEATLRQADMIEIQFGYGALGPVPLDLRPENISPEFARFLDLKPGQPLTYPAAFPRIDDAQALAKLVTYLRDLTGGVPIGLKFGATQYLEKELAVFIKADLDFITIDGAEAGIYFGPPTLADDLGLPTLSALCRAVNFLEKQRLPRKPSLLISGGFFTPGQVLKALALGADAVNIGTIACISLSHSQLSKVLPWEPPTELIYENGKYKNRLNVKIAARDLTNFLTSCQEEMVQALRCLGKNKVTDLQTTDMVALNLEVAQMTGVEFALTPKK